MRIATLIAIAVTAAPASAAGTNARIQAAAPTEISTAHRAPPSRLDRTPPERLPSWNPIRVGERHEMEISYLGIPGLKVDMEVLPNENHESTGRPAFHVRAHAVNSKLVGIFFSIDSSVESWFDQKGLFSYKLELRQNQSNLVRRSVETYDFSSAVTRYFNRWNKPGQSAQEQQLSAPITPFAQDSFSAFYFLRTLKLATGDVVRIPVVSEGRMIEVQATVEDRESLDIYAGEMRAIPVRLEKIGPNGVAERADNRVWLSDDDRRALLKLNVQARFGKFVGTLMRFLPGPGDNATASVNFED